MFSSWGEDMMDMQERNVRDATIELLWPQGTRLAATGCPSLSIRPEAGYGRTRWVVCYEFSQVPIIMFHMCIIYNHEHMMYLYSNMIQFI